MPTETTKIDIKGQVWLTHDRNWVVVQNSNNDSVIIFNVEDTKLTCEIKLPELNDWQLQTSFVSPDGRYLMAMDKSGTDWCILDQVEHTVIPKFMSFHDKIHHKSYLVQDVKHSAIDERYFSTFFLDNDRVMTVIGTGEILVWSLSNRSLLWAVGASSHVIDSIEFANSKKVFTTSEHLIHPCGRNSAIGKVGLYHTRGKRIFFHNVGEEFHWQHNSRLDRYGSSEELATGHKLRLWNFYSGELLQTFETENAVGHLAFSKDDKLLAGGEGIEWGRFPRSACIWDVETGYKVQRLSLTAKSIGFSHDDRYLAVQLDDHQIRFWDVQDESWHNNYTFEGVITSVQMTDEDKIIALEKRGQDIPSWYIHQITLD